MGGEGCRVVRVTEEIEIPQSDERRPSREEQKEQRFELNYERRSHRILNMSKATDRFD
jgi:hypothetical protein